MYTVIIVQSFTHANLTVGLIYCGLHPVVCFFIVNVRSPLHANKTLSHQLIGVYKVWYFHSFAFV